MQLFLPSLNRKILAEVIVFLLLGQMMLFSASAVLGLQRHGDEFYFIFKQALAALIGLVIMFVFSWIPYQKYRRLAWPLLFSLILLVGATYTSLGRYASGATRWLTLGGVSFQPSEASKVIVALFIAALLDQNEKTPFSPKLWVRNLLPLLVLGALVLLQPDLGTTVLLCSLFISTCFLAGLRPIYLLGTVSLGVVFVAIALVSSEYRRRRFLGFLNPWADPQGSGFQMIQSFLSFHSGGVLGQGIGNGTSKLFYLPEVHTDFIFSLVGEELGFVGASILILLFAHFIYLLFKTSLLPKDSFGRYLAFGLAFTMAFQIAVNLGGVTGLLPVKGLPLPFFSWGRSALLVNLAMIGILLNIVKQSSEPPTPEGAR
jgi:cell division protein FtsW